MRVSEGIFRLSLSRSRLLCLVIVSCHRRREVTKACPGRRGAPGDARLRVVGMWALSLLSLLSFAITQQPTRGFVSVPRPHPCHQRVIRTTDRLLGLFGDRRDDDDDEGQQRDESSAWIVPAQMLIDKATDDPQRSISFSIFMAFCGAMLVCLGTCEVFASAF